MYCAVDGRIHGPVESVFGVCVVTVVLVCALNFGRHVIGVTVSSVFPAVVGASVVDEAVLTNVASGHIGGGKDSTVETEGYGVFDYPAHVSG